MYNPLVLVPRQQKQKKFPYPALPPKKVHFQQLRQHSSPYGHRVNWKNELTLIKKCVTKNGAAFNPLEVIGLIPSLESQTAVAAEVWGHRWRWQRAGNPQNLQPRTRYVELYITLYATVRGTHHIFFRDEAMKKSFSQFLVLVPAVCRL